jgi:hypothetical protein
MYRDVMREGLDASKFEHELRCYVVRKRCVNRDRFAAGVRSA